MTGKNSAKISKVSKVDKNLKLRKTSTKPELLLQIKALLELNDTLEEEIRKKSEVLEGFGEKIENLEKQLYYLSCKETMISQETQTEAVILSRCDECNFEAKNEKELGWHLGRQHGWQKQKQAGAELCQAQNKMG